ncbi:nucleolin 2-like [Juglans microcarpa x Juglans regia]|uniref:nucleolin 2-like n=1 Tax=Juglans microcarpa x Juglans regia TaxID=2249226 RepID=UPI001B7F00C0|nr:nucleolin 2-like [Juglans microcarpa x Juglans regia]
MGKSNKKSIPKVDAAPAIVPPSKSAKKGKREAVNELEKQLSAKRQKRNEAVEQTVQKQKSEVKTQKKKKQEETSSSDDSSSWTLKKKRSLLQKSWPLLLKMVLLLPLLRKARRLAVRILRIQILHLILMMIKVQRLR